LSLAGHLAARTGRSPYFWTVLSRPDERRSRLGEGLKAIARIIALGLVMDAAYQYVVLGTFYPGEALVFWSALLQRNMEPGLLERASKSIAS